MLPFITAKVQNIPISFLIDTGSNYSEFTFNDYKKKKLLRNFEEVDGVESQGLGGEQEDVMYGKTTTHVDFKTIKLPIEFYVMKEECSLPSSILGFNFFLTHSCNFSKDNKTKENVMSILGNHTIPLEFNHLPHAINVAQVTPTPKKTSIDETEIKITNTDCIPMAEQIVPSPLLTKIFKTSQKATERITAYCNVLQVKKKKIDSTLHDEQDRVNLDYQSLDPNETLNNDSLENYLEMKLELPQVTKTNPFEYNSKHLDNTQKRQMDALLRKYEKALNDGTQICTLKLFEAAIHLMPSKTAIQTRRNQFRSDIRSNCENGKARHH